MARIFLNIYVATHIMILLINLAVNIFGDETVQILSKDDWLIFIIACGSLAISETIEYSKGRE